MENTHICRHFANLELLHQIFNDILNWNSSSLVFLKQIISFNSVFFFVIIFLKFFRSGKKKPSSGEVLMVKEEKALVRAAAKAPEQFDSWGTVEREARRVADWIKQAKHCVTFTGMEISPIFV